MTANHRSTDGVRVLDRGFRSLREWLSDLFNDEPENRGELMEMPCDAADRQLMDGELSNVKVTTPIEDFNAYFGIEFRADELDTSGGIVLKAFGHVPRRGELADVGGMRFEVLAADARRLRLLRVSRVP